MLHQGEIICQDTSGGIAIDVVNGEITVDNCDIGYGDGADGVVLRDGVSTCRIVDSRFEWPSQDAGKYPIKILDGSTNHYIAGNFYTVGCTVPNVFVETPADTQYIQLDAYARFDSAPDGSAVLNTPTSLNGSVTAIDPVLVAADATNAVAVRHADLSPFVRIDTSSDQVWVANGAQVALFSDALNTMTLSMSGQDGSITVSGPLISDGSAPTISVGAAAGTGATAAIFGTDTAGVIRLTTGTSPTTGQLFEIVWSSPKPSENYAVVLTAASATAVTGLQRFYMDQDNGTDTLIDAIATTALTASALHRIYYQVISF
jgi:hypothetical protein